MKRATLGILVIIASLVIGCGPGGGSSDNDSDASNPNPITDSDSTDSDATSDSVEVKEYEVTTTENVVRFNDDEIQVLSFTTINNDGSTTGEIDTNTRFEYSAKIVDNVTLEDSIGKPLLDGNNFLGIVESVQQEGDRFKIVTKPANRIKDIFSMIKVDFDYNPTTNEINSILSKHTQNSLEKNTDTILEGTKQIFENNIGYYLKSSKLIDNQYNVSNFGSNPVPKDPDSIIRISMPENHVVGFTVVEIDGEGGIAQVIPFEMMDYSDPDGVIEFNASSSIEIGLNVKFNGTIDTKNKEANNFNLTLSNYYKANLDITINVDAIYQRELTIKLLEKPIVAPIPIGNGFYFNIEFMPVIVIDSQGEIEASLQVKAAYERNGSSTIAFDFSAPEGDKISTTTDTTKDKSERSYSIVFSGTAAGNLTFSPSIEISPELTFTKIIDVIEIGYLRGGLDINNRITGTANLESYNGLTETEGINGNFELYILATPFINYLVELETFDYDIYEMEEEKTLWRSSSPFVILHYTHNSNSAPTVDAGDDQSVIVGSTVTLDGTGSDDPEGDNRYYNWLITNKPTGSTASLLNSNSEHPTFIADKSGTYIVQLIVNDGELYSEPDYVNILVSEQSAPTKTIVSLSINGGSSIDEGSSSSFSATATYSDGTTQQVSPNWTDNCANGNIVSGTLSADYLSSDESCSLTATYGGKTATKSITIENVISTYKKYPDHDATVWSSYPKKEFGTGDRLDITNWTDGTKYLAYLHFNTCSIPTNATIYSASLNLRISSKTGNPLVRIRRVKGDNWDEGTINYDNSPTDYYSSPAWEGNPPSPTNWWMISVKNYIEYWISNCDYNLGFRMDIYNSGEWAVSIYAKDLTTSNYKPYLYVTYSID
jgi:hypothetical protein